MKHVRNNSYHIFFTNLANPLKISIMLSLKESEKNVTQLYKDLEVEQSKISHALASLKSCNIVKSRQNGKQRIYYLNKTTIPKILELTDEHAKSFCGKPYCSCDRSKCMKNMRR